MKFPKRLLSITLTLVLLLSIIPIGQVAYAQETTAGDTFKRVTTAAYKTSLKPSASGAWAVVAEKDGKYYAMGKRTESQQYFPAVEVTVTNDSFTLTDDIEYITTAPVNGYSGNLALSDGKKLNVPDGILNKDCRNSDGTHTSFVSAGTTDYPYWTWGPASDIRAVYVNGSNTNLTYLVFSNDRFFFLNYTNDKDFGEDIEQFSLNYHMFQQICADDAHTWVEQSSTATCDTEGEATYECSICRETKTETAPAKGHHFQSSGDKYVCTVCHQECTGTPDIDTLTYNGKTYSRVKKEADFYNNATEYIVTTQLGSDMTLGADLGAVSVGYTLDGKAFVNGTAAVLKPQYYTDEWGNYIRMFYGNNVNFKLGSGYLRVADGKLVLAADGGAKHVGWRPIDTSTEGLWNVYYYDYAAGISAFLKYSASPSPSFGVDSSERQEFYIYQRVCDHAAKETHEAVPATCTELGNVEYSYCPTCGAYYDASGSSKNQWGGRYYPENFTTKPLGHHYVNGVCTHDSSHKALEYTLVTSADMLSTDAKYRYVIANEDNKVLGINHTNDYPEMAVTGATVDSNGKLTLDNSSDADGVYGAEFALEMFVPDDKGMSLPEDGTPLYTLFANNSYGLLAMGSLWLDYSTDGNAKYPLGISPADDGVTTIRSWNYGDWGEPIVYSTDEKSKTEGFALGETANVKLYRGEVVEETPAHEHIWSEDWSSDNTSHWHDCTAAGCDITENTGKDGYGAHTFGEWTENATGGAPYRECTVCGYKETAAPVRLYAVTDCDGNSVGDIQLSPSKTGYYVGDEVTLTAPAVPGYSFNGWYQDDQYDQAVCSSLAYTLTLEDNTKLVASYTASGSAIVTISAVNGAQYTVGDSQTIQSGSTENVPVGSTLTLTAVDADKVLQWQNESSKVLGRGAGLTVTVTGNMSITLVYKAETTNQSYVQFVSDYGQVLSAKMYSESDAILIPDSPTKFGYTFTGWVFDGTTDEATEETIKAKIGSEPTITVKPNYTKDETYGSATVNYMTQIFGNIEMTTIADETVINNIPTGNAQELTAKDIDGYTFVCWKNADGTVLGYDKSYTIMVAGDHTLIAYYVADGGEIETAKPVIVIDELYTVTSGSTHKVSGKVNRTIPDGYTLIEHGVLYARNVADLNEATFVYGTEGVGKYISNDTMANGVVTLNVKVASDDVTVSLRGYMLLVNNTTGNQEYFYTDIRSGSYNSINNN